MYFEDKKNPVGTRHCQKNFIYNGQILSQNIETTQASKSWIINTTGIKDSILDSVDSNQNKSS